MSSVRGKPPVNCTPCAQRKVRCDRGLPCCSHCRRRKNDRCVYPVVQVKQSPNRIAQLESYIRTLGGDPSLLESTIPNRQLSTEATASSPLNDSHDAVQETHAEDKQRCLIQHNEDVVYTEVPMWYSWKYSKKSEETASSPLPPQKSTIKPDVRRGHVFPTLLDPINLAPGSADDGVIPYERNMMTLWRTYLRNVHPLVMIFFDWEIEHLIQRASRNRVSLSPGENALVLGIMFIAVTSMSDDQCLGILNDGRSQAFTRLQKAAEASLLTADFIATSERFTLQAFMLYLLVIQSRARPAITHSLTGIAFRIAERMGIHRDGGELKLSVLRSEERRRMWWQLQHMEIAAAQHIGCISSIIYADWNANLPSNIEDRDLRFDMEVLPPPRRGLTTISHCLWRYEILHMQRKNRQAGGKLEGVAWLLSPNVSIADKDAKIDITERALNEMFVQYCEPLEPLHLLIQIGVRSFIVAARRLLRQPSLVNAKISQMSSSEREDFLLICQKALEYYVLLQTSESLRGFQWQSEVYSQWPALVYVLLEAHHRYDNDAVEDLWSLIRRVFAVHPSFATAVQTPDVVAIVGIAVVAWQRRHDYLQLRSRQLHSIDRLDTPPWIAELCEKFGLPDPGASVADTVASTMQEPIVDPHQLLPFDFDFNTMDWSFWENSALDTAWLDVEL